jgi:hypothetical protein
VSVILCHHKIEPDSLSLKMRSSLRLIKHFRPIEFNKSQLKLIPIRTLASKPPGSDPLDVLRIECAARNLCSEDGRRSRGAHWVLSLAVAQSNTSKVSEAKSATAVLNHVFIPHADCFLAAS